MAEAEICGLCGCTYMRCRIHAGYHPQLWHSIHFNPWTTTSGVPIGWRMGDPEPTDFVAFITKLMAYREVVNAE